MALRAFRSSLREEGIAKGRPVAYNVLLVCRSIPTLGKPTLNTLAGHDLLIGHRTCHTVRVHLAVEGLDNL